MSDTGGVGPRFVALAIIKTVALGSVAHAAQFNIAAQPAAQAIAEFGRQAGVQIMAPAAIMDGVRINPTHGEMEPRQALRTLLKGTGLRIIADDGRTIVLGREVPNPRPIQLAALNMVTQPRATPTPAAPPVRETPSLALGEIIVTANRRAESAQSVPIAVTALSSEEIRRTGAVDTNALTGKIPSLSIPHQGPKLYFLRGVGTTGTSNNVEQSVATYIDGVYLYSTWAAGVPFTGMERVEVLKGPQGTLFGRNTTGGVIQGVTRDPLQDPTVEASVGYGNYDTATGTFFGSTRLADTLGVSLAVDYRDQGKGYGYNRVRDERTMYHDNLSVQFKTAFAPDDDTRLTAFFWYDRSKSSGWNSKIAPGYAGADGVVRDLDRYEFVADTRDALNYKSYLGYLRLDRDFGDVNLVSISAYRKLDMVNYLDQDATPARVIEVNPSILPLSNFSQEIQLLSPETSKLKWLVGGYYFWGEASYLPIVLMGSGAGAAGQIEYYRTQKTESAAAFGQASYEILDNLTLTAGLRYTSEHQYFLPAVTSIRGEVIDRMPGDKQDSSGWTYRLAVDYKLSPDVMLYASYNRGLKSGGFTLVTLARIPGYEPEKLDAYEVGFKSELFDRRVRLNAAAYYYKFSDIQVGQTTTGGIQVGNAASAEIKGVDIDVEATIIRNLTASGSIGIVDGEYTDYPNAVAFIPTPTGARPVGFNGKGMDTVFSPHFSWTAGLNYTLPLASAGNLDLNMFVQHVDKQYSAADNALPIQAHTVANASISWQSDGGRFGATLWARNLFDEVYDSNAQESPLGYYHTPAPPRTYGLTLSTKF